MIRGATWTPAYDLRLDTQTDSMSCTYYGRVAQSTTEDWEGTVELVTLAVFCCHPCLRAAIGYTDHPTLQIVHEVSQSINQPLKMDTTGVPSISRFTRIT